MKRRNLKTNRAVYILLILWLAVSACQNNTYYHSYQSASTAGWHKNDTFVFSLPNTISPLNYEVDVYVESQKRLPSKEVTLETTEVTYYFFKADILKGLITYSTERILWLMP